MPTKSKKKSTSKKRTAKKTTRKTKAAAAKSTKKKSAKKTTATKSRRRKSTAKAEEKAEVVTIDRRREADRRDIEAGEVAETKAQQPLERRKKVNRRRQIDPTTCERDYSVDEIEFMSALDDYKRKSGRMFPTCSEVLEVIRNLGYRKPAEAGEQTSEDTAQVGDVLPQTSASEFTITVDESAAGQPFVETPLSLG